MSSGPTVNSTAPPTTPTKQIPLADDLSAKAAPPAKSNGCRNLLIGCGCLTAVSFALGMAGTYWVVNNWRFLAAESSSLFIKSAVRELQIPVAQRQRINQRLDQLAQQYTDGELTDEQLVRILKNIVEGPLLPAGSVLVVERQYLDDSGLDAVEKEAARGAIQRFAHGSLDESIPPETVSEVLDTISESGGPEGQRNFRQFLTDDELRDFVTAATEAADEAGVPAEVPDVNFADEFDKAVDEALDPDRRSP